jgi:hypothetical protein
MATPQARTFWERGIDNRRTRDTLPIGYAHDIVNMDPLLGGNLSARMGFSRVYEGTDVRGVLALDRYLLIADGTSLVCYDLETNTQAVLRQIAGAGPFVGDILNGELFFCTASECLRFKDGAVRRWGVEDQQAQPTVAVTGTGVITEGRYKFAATLVDAAGDEGGTSQFAYLDAPNDSAITITLPTPPAGYSYKVYAGYTNSTELYLQAEGSAPFVLTGLVDNTPSLETAFMSAPQPGHAVAVDGAIIAVAVDSEVQFTSPFHPHLRAPMSGFLQYPDRVGILLAAPGRLVVSAEATYLVEGAGTNQVSQLKTSDYPGLPGSGANSADGAATWMTQYGQAILGPEAVSMPNKDTFTPMLAQEGAAGIIEHNGNRLAVTTMRGVPRDNPLATSDYFEAEVINP